MGTDMIVELEKATPGAEQPQEDQRGSDCSCTNSWKNWFNLCALIVNTVITYTSLTGAFGKTNTELSNKYQTLVTPAGWAFSIWGPIFIWETIFVVAQFFPRFRRSEVVLRMSPWWWALCGFQCCWTFAFAQDQVTLALIFMLLILSSLLGVAWSTDGLNLSIAEYLLLRAPLSLQLGWIICAAAVNINVQADALKASQSSLLAVAILTYAAVVSSRSLSRSSLAVLTQWCRWLLLGLSWASTASWAILRGSRTQSVSIPVFGMTSCSMVSEVLRCLSALRRSRPQLLL